MPVVVCAGLVTVDTLFELPDYPREGAKVRAEAMRTVAGGGALNAAAAVAALGGQALLAGAVGDDEPGRFVRGRLAALGIDDALLATLPGVPTARSAVLLTAGGERTVVNHRDARLFAHGPATLPRSVDAVLADTRWPMGARALVEAAARTGCPAVLDVEAPAGDAADAFARATHLAFSEQGLGDLAGAATPDALQAMARRYGVWAALTRGVRSVLHSDGAGLREAATFPVEAIDTLGAGDVWHGALALGLAGGLDAPDALLRANAAAALKVARRSGAPLPTAAEVDRFLRNVENGAASPG